MVFSCGGLHPSLCQSSFSGVALQKIWRTYVELFEAWNMQFLPIFSRDSGFLFPQRILFFLGKKFPWQNHFRPQKRLAGLMPEERVLDQMQQSMKLHKVWGHPAVKPQCCW